MPDLLTGFGVAALVLVVAALAAGLVDRAPLSFPMIFLALGFLLGPSGAGLLHLDAHDRTLEAIAILNLALVLFLDAVKLQLDELGRDWPIPVLALGPGTLLITALVAGAALLLLQLPLVHALLLGAILASTDPVVLRDVVRDPRLPRAVRQALSVEAGTNDVVVLPLVLVLLAVALARAGTPGEWAVFLARVFLLGPAVGFVVGAIGSWLMMRVDAALGVRREYQALYGLGLVLAAYTGGLAVGGDGFLAAFAAGAAITVLNHELCDCFLEYGEVTAEMAMLLAFILFGAVLSTLLGTVPLGRALLLALFAIVVARPLALALVLARARLSPTGRVLIAWFGPRGLSSLLFALLTVQAGLPDGERLLALVGVVVIVSVVVHGCSATPVATWYARCRARQTLAEEREESAADLFRPAEEAVPRIAPAELAARLAGPAPPLVLDVRSAGARARDPVQIPGSVPVPPDAITRWAVEQAARRPVVTWCT